MGTRSIVKVLVDERKEQYYHHFDGYLEGVGWELFRKYFSLAHRMSRERVNYNCWLMDRTETCNLSRDLGCEYEPEPWNTRHGDIEYEYLLDFNRKNFQVQRYVDHRIRLYTFEDMVKEIAKGLRSRLCELMDQEDDIFLECMRRTKGL